MEMSKKKNKNIDNNILSIYYILKTFLTDQRLYVILLGYLNELKLKKISFYAHRVKATYQMNIVFVAMFLKY